MNKGTISIDKVRESSTWAELICFERQYDMFTAGQWISLEDAAEFTMRGFSVSQDTEYQYVDIGSVNRELGVIEAVQIYKGEELPKRAKKVIAANDVLVATVRTEVEGVIFVDREYDSAVASNGFAVLKSKDFTPEYLFYCLRLPSTMKQFEEYSKGTNFPQLSLKDLKRIQIPVVDNDLMEAITIKVQEYLRNAYNWTSPEKALDIVFQDDSETDFNKDTMIFRVPIGLFDERWDIGAFRGKNRSTGGAQLANYLVSTRTGYTVPKRLIADVESQEKAYTILGPKQVGLGTLKLDGVEQSIHLDEKDVNRHVLSEGAILLVRVGSDLGRAALVDKGNKYVANQHLIVLEVDKTVILPEYLTWLINTRSVKQRLGDFAVGTHMRSLGVEDIRSLNVVIPDILTQKEVVANITLMTDRTIINELKQELDAIT